MSTFYVQLYFSTELKFVFVRWIKSPTTSWTPTSSQGRPVPGPNSRPDPGPSSRPTEKPVTARLLSKFGQPGTTSRSPTRTTPTNSQSRPSFRPSSRPIEKPVIDRLQKTTQKPKNTTPDSEELEVIECQGGQNELTGFQERGCVSLRDEKFIQAARGSRHAREEILRFVFGDGDSLFITIFASIFSALGIILNMLVLVAVLNYPITRKHVRKCEFCFKTSRSIFTFSMSSDVHKHPTLLST